MHFPVKTKDLSLPKDIQTNSWAQLPVSWILWELSPKLKQLMHESGNSPPCNAEVKNK
jgi:hypothetical protein